MRIRTGSAMMAVAALAGMASGLGISSAYTLREEPPIPPVPAKSRRPRTLAKQVMLRASVALLAIPDKAMTKRRARRLRGKAKGARA